MYISKLTVNPADRGVQRDLGRIYEMHRTVMTAFPAARDGGPGRVLYRVDLPRRASTRLPEVLVVSEHEPDWSALANRTGYLAVPPEHKSYRPAVTLGQVLRFRLRANPTVRRDGKRLGLYREPEQLEWLKRKAREHGFQILRVESSSEGKALGRAGDAAGGERTLTFCSVLFEGLLRVADPAVFESALSTGVGAGKGLGFGLLTAAPGAIP
jgi:CRISPR system Cascade subunit CasE